MSSLWVVYAELVLLSCLGLVRAQNEKPVVFTLGMFQNVSIPVNGSVEVNVSRIPAEVAFVTLQFHTQHRNATMSYTRVPAYGSAVTTVDSGLLFPLSPAQSSLSCFLLAPDGDSVAGIAVILPYSSTDPVPGACNLEFPLEIDPNIYLLYNLYETIIRFAPANIGYARGVSPPLCDVETDLSSRWRLEYDVYQYFLPENDLSERSLLSGVETVAGAPSMLQNGRKLMTLSSRDKTLVSFNSIPGQGVIYSVIVRDPVYNSSASYVPVHTYACSFTSAVDGCITLGRTSSKVFFTITGLAGLLVCFLGHRFFKCVRLALTTLIGVVGGVVLVMTWWRFGSVMACVVVAGLILGFLISSIVFFTPFGDLSVFHEDVAFWVTFSGIVLVVPLFFTRWPRVGNILTCGVVGGYMVVLAVNAYVYTSLSYITLDVLKRFLNENFSRAFISVPLQTTDFILIGVWVLLGVSGITVQLYRERSRPYFPPSPYILWCQERERRKTNVLDPSHHTPSLAARLLARARQLTRHQEPAGERTPLLL
ncbi:transmembrane 7 superfamily member 3 isoform X2 [Ictalurus punctatus]|uniref:Transmembrane 7 superfamily member 3 isoform X2 n=1 Tax=Ictalurus punctatus TaxID=7998 RepID=A0A2D0SEI8_ICTPU|nr:transmembrane 7 superfamily member 3 isoform X2 [Ictalurus punctatus]